MNVISIDWDFVFPDTYPYDWGHREAMLFIESLWPMRWGNLNLNTKAKAHKEMRVNKEHLDFLIKKVIDNINPVALCIAESHSCLPEFVHRKGIPKKIINYDAHHDAGYGQTEVLECGNWARYLKKAHPNMKYEIVYPNWREKEKEHGIPRYSKVSLMKNTEPPTFTDCILFVCRSGAWTPSWEDNKWIKFITLLRKKFSCSLFCQDMALIERKFNLQEAKALEKRCYELISGKVGGREGGV